MKLKYIIILFLPLLFVNCDESLDEFNVDPTRPTAVGLDLSLPEVLASAAYNEGGEAPRAAGIIMQQYEGSDAQQLQYTTYNFAEATFNNFWRTGLYAGVLKSCQVIIDNASESNSSFYSGVAKLIMAQQYGIATSYFGDLPMSQALQGPDILKPLYDDQEMVYNAVLAMLDDAIADLSVDADDYNGGDLVYGGDAASWIKTAHGLKARFYLHLSKRDAANYGRALSSIENSYESAEEEAALTFDDTDTGNWSIAAFSSERGGTLKMDENFVTLMANDPRRDVIMSGSDIDGFWTANDATVPYISFTELKFIEAECKVAMGEDANDSYIAAITSNFERYSLSADTLAFYLDDIGDVEGMSGDAAVEKIVSEAYKAYFGYNFHETWSNWRRTGFPNLTPKEDGANGSNPSGVIPVRFQYASSEITTNSANVEAAKAAQGGALLDDPLWVFE